MNYYFKDIVTPYKPQIVVLYAGDNDLADNKKPENILNDFKKFIINVLAISKDIPALIKINFKLTF